MRDRLSSSPVYTAGIKRRRILENKSSTLSPFLSILLPSYLDAFSPHGLKKTTLGPSPLFHQAVQCRASQLLVLNISIHKQAKIRVHLLAVLLKFLSFHRNTVMHCEHNIDIFSTYKVVMVTVLANHYL